MTSSTRRFFSFLASFLLPVLPVAAESPGEVDIAFDPGSSIDGNVHALAPQPNGQWLIAGSFTTVHDAFRGGLARLNADGSTDHTFMDGLSGANHVVYAIEVQSDGKLLIGGGFTSVHGQPRNRIARLHSDGTLDPTFLDGLPGANGAVHSMAVQPDGKILIAGSFTSINGETRNRIARLNTDGSLDTSFGAGMAGADNLLSTVALQSDGKILIGGWFTTVNGQTRNRIARLDANGSLDTSFGQGLTGANNNVETVAVQADGKILIGGRFTSINDETRFSIARLDSNGAIDDAFDAGGSTQSGYDVHSISLQNGGSVLIGGNFGIRRLHSDGVHDSTFGDDLTIDGGINTLAIDSTGRVIAGGTFATVNDLPRGRVVRLEANGILDTTFENSSGGIGGAGAFRSVLALSVQEDGKIVVGGSFPLVGGEERQRIARLNPTGSLDDTFNDELGGANGAVSTFARQENGDLLVGGSFTAIRGEPRNRIARLRADGTLDSFAEGTIGPDGGVNAMTIQDDGRVVIGGSFTKVDGSFRNGIARLNVDGTVDTSFVPESNPFVDGRWIVRSIAVQPDGKIVAAGRFENTFAGSNHKNIARFHPDGTLDTSFSGFASNIGAVESIAVQSDGKIVIGGFFSFIEGELRNGIARLNPDGSLDRSFGDGLAGVSGGSGLGVHAVALDAFGRILVGGLFPQIRGEIRGNIARLNPDGTLDASFGDGLSGSTGVVRVIALDDHGDVFVGGTFGAVNATPRGSLARLHGGIPEEAAPGYPGEMDLSFNPGSSMNNGLRGITRHADGKWIVTGDFTTVHGAMRGRIARLHEDGQTDHSFMHGLAGANAPVEAAIVQDDGKMIIVGYFTEVNGVARNRIARLNDDGSLDSAFGHGLAGADGPIMSAAIDSQGKIVIGGDFSTIHGQSRNRIARLNPDGTFDTTFGEGLAGADAWIQIVAIQDDGEILVGGGFTSIHGVARNRIARLNSDGTLDETFGHGLQGASGAVFSLFEQADGQILVGGAFAAVNGVTRRGIARLNPDGSLDTTFGNGMSGVGSPLMGANGAVYSVDLQTDGQILIGGWFHGVNGVALNHVARLHPDGSVDTAFAAGQANRVTDHMVLAISQQNGQILLGGFFEKVYDQPQSWMALLNADGSLDTTFPPGASGPAGGSVRSVAVQENGAVLIGGEFTTVGGQPRNRVARLLSNGSLDTTFGNNLAGADNWVMAIVPQDDGKILIGGGFTTINGVTRNRIARLHADGTLDTSFANGLAGADNPVDAIAVQSDGKILIGGRFTMVNGQPRNRIARLNADGTLDTTFGEGMPGANVWVMSIVPQSDSKILIGGLFTSVNGVTRSRIARLHPDGSLDHTFGDGLAGADNRVYSVALQSDGKVLIGGWFSAVNGVPSPGIARLNADGAFDHSFSGNLTGDDFTQPVIALQEDGKILVGGNFTAVHGVNRNRIARLNSDGTLDSAFGDGLSGANDDVYAIATQSDGSILIGGNFSSVNGIPVDRVARLHGGSGPVPNGYETWAETLPEGQRSPTDDPGGFGIANLLRYAFGMDPLQPEHGKLPLAGTATITEGEQPNVYLTLTYTRRTDDNTLVYLVEASGDLLTWLPFAGDEQVSDGGDEETQIVTVIDTEPIAATERRFLRVRAER